MPVEVDFQGKKNIYIHFQFQAPWTIKEFKDAEETALAWTKSLDDAIDTVLDFTNAPALPSGIISEGLDVIKRTQEQPNQGNTVVVTSRPLVKSIIQVISRLIPSWRLCFAQDMNEAEQMIARFAKDHAYSGVVPAEEYRMLSA